MSNERDHCQATTKAGTRCKNYPIDGSTYCRVHQNYAVSGVTDNAPAAPQKSPAPDKATADDPVPRQEFEVLVNELNALAAELQRRVPEYSPPDFSIEALIRLLQRSWQHFTPEVQLTLLTELRGNLEGTSPSDLVDPDTWKGLWYILTYMAQARTEQMRSQLVECLADLPGASFLSDLWHNLEGTSPREFLDPETWRGLFLVLNYTLRGQINDLKQKIMGEEEVDVTISASESE